jgi:hypothetical protein
VSEKGAGGDEGGSEDSESRRAGVGRGASVSSGPGEMDRARLVILRGVLVLCHNKSEMWCLS